MLGWVARTRRALGVGRWLGKDVTKLKDYINGCICYNPSRKICNIFCFALCLGIQI